MPNLPLLQTVSEPINKGKIELANETNYSWKQITVAQARMSFRGTGLWKVADPARQVLKKCISYAQIKWFCIKNEVWCSRTNVSLFCANILSSQAVNILREPCSEDICSRIRHPTQETQPLRWSQANHCAEPRHPPRHKKPSREIHQKDPQEPGLAPDHQSMCKTFLWQQGRFLL